MLELNQILQGDSLELLKQLPDNSINCSIQSPPYFLCRDYGTAKWIGGDSTCDHVSQKTGMSQKNTLGTNGQGHSQNNQQNRAGIMQFSKECKKCGALREDKQVGLEETPEQYIERLASIFDEVRRVLREDGCCFVNLGDTYLGSGKGIWYGRADANKESFQFQEKPKEVLGGWRKKKQLALIPSRFAIEMQNRGWWLRNKIIWYKKNALPQSCKDRFVVDYEEILFFTKSYKYNFKQLIEPFANSSNANEIYTGKATKDYESAGAQNPSDTKRRILEKMKERGGRSMRSVWEINTKPSKGNHTASYPEKLVERMIESGCPPGGVTLDIFNGTGTTCAVAKRMGRNYLGFDLSEEYCEIARDRIQEILL